MGTPIQAMIWELWRTSRVSLLIRSTWMLAIVVLVQCYLSFTSVAVDDPQTQVFVGMSIGILVAMSIASPLWIVEIDRTVLGFSFRLGFTRPVTTTTLVAVPMLYTIVTSVFCYLLSASLLGWFSGTSMPLVAQATIVASMVTCFVAATWTPPTHAGKAMSLLTVGILMIGCSLLFHSQHNTSTPMLYAMGDPEYFNMGWQHYAVILAIPLLAFVVTVRAVDRQRHGERQRIGTRRRLIFAATPKRLPPFRNRFTAQCWYEMRNCGLAVFLGGLVVASLVLTFVSIVSRLDPGWDAAPVVWLVALVVCPFVCQLIAADRALGIRRKHGAISYSSFDATRAMSSDRLIASKLLVIAACSLVGWSSMAIAAGLHSILADNWHLWGRIGEAASRLVGGVPVYWWVAALLSTPLLYISSSSILLAFGLWAPRHGKSFSTVAIILYAHGILAIWDANHDWMLRYLWTACGYTLAVVIVAGCLITLRRASAAGLLGKWLFGSAFCLWIVYVVLMISLSLNVESADKFPLAAIVLGGSLLLVPLAATAAAPLALASYRHG